MQMGRMKKTVFGIAVLWLSVNLALAYPAVEGYRQKMELAALAMGSDGTQSGNAEAPEADAKQRMVQYLKDGILSGASDGYDLLQELGYTGNYYGALQRQLFRQIVWNGAATGAAIAVVLAVCILGNRRRRKMRESAVREICGQIEALRQNSAGFSRMANTEEDVWQTKLYDFSEQVDYDGIIRIREELAMLADHMKLLRETARTERERTKALVTDLSHQIRTPLTAFQMNFDLLASGDLRPDEYDEFFLRCRVQLERLLELTDALLQISRLETGLIELRPKCAPLFDTILMAVNRIYPRAQEKQIELIFEELQEAEELFVLPHDPRWLSEALINILENAVKYSGSDSQIRISFCRMAASVRIEIEDHGIGILAQERNQIFRRFWRGQDARVQAQEGQGIGLYLSRQIIEKHHGTIRVASVMPHGSCFIVSLPLAQT